jgi:hypothetical protein
MVEGKAQARSFLEGLLGGEAPAEALLGRVDWPRLGLMQLMQASAGAEAAARDELIARGLDALGKAQLGRDMQERALASLRSLIEILIGRTWRFVDGYENPLLEGLRAGPLPSTPPALRRYLERLAEVARAAQPVTIAARDPDAGKVMTLLFVDGAYAGFLPGALAAPRQ